MARSFLLAMALMAFGTEQSAEPITVDDDVAPPLKPGANNWVLAKQDRYRRRYIPGQELYLSACKPREAADIVIDNSDFERPFIVGSDGNVSGR